MSKQKIRTDFRKNRTPRKRSSDLTRRFERDDADQLDEPHEERISGKGELTRRRTVVGTEAMTMNRVSPWCRKSISSSASPAAFSACMAYCASLRPRMARFFVAQRGGFCGHFRPNSGTWSRPATTFCFGPPLDFLAVPKLWTPMPARPKG